MLMDGGAGLQIFFLFRRTNDRPKQKVAGHSLLLAGHSLLLASQSKMYVY